MMITKKLFAPLVLTVTLLSHSGESRKLYSSNGSSRRLSPASSELQHTDPYFTSRPKTYKARVGSSVTMECQVDNLGESTVIWKQSNRIISAGSTIIRKDSRISLQNGFSLRIDDLQQSDVGEYVCEIETFGEPIDQENHLEILVPPTVRTQPMDGNFVVRKGSTINLECQADGNPKPNITWQRENNLLPSGRKVQHGDSITIQDVTRHHSGIYLCTANNGVGEPTTAKIDLKVLYSPEIEMDQSWVRTKDGIEAEVTCSVHAEPKAEVSWYKETMLLKPTNHRHMEVYGSKHVLILKGVRETDFGNYSCAAGNSIGNQRAFIDVSGRPHPAKIVSPSLSYFKDSYNLTWTVDSFLPIEEYRILYRPATLTDSQRYNRQSTHYDQTGNDWTNIIPTINDNRPTHTYKTSFTYTGNFMFYGLSPSTEYEVIIQSRNKEGWSDPNDIFRFSTRSTDYNPMELASHNQQGFSSSVSPSTQISFLAYSLNLAVLMFFAVQGILNH